MTQAKNEEICEVIFSDKDNFRCNKKAVAKVTYGEGKPFNVCKDCLKLYNENPEFKIIEFVPKKQENRTPCNECLNGICINGVHNHLKQENCEICKDYPKEYWCGNPENKPNDEAILKENNKILKCLTGFNPYDKVETEFLDTRTDYQKGFLAGQEAERKSQKEKILEMIDGCELQEGRLFDNTKLIKVEELKNKIENEWGKK